ncbi:MAG: hypothetical protein Q4C52_05290 [Eubacteriales bacterium]|nr:hypothetical protein [Eubacteriales bacterium]
MEIKLRLGGILFSFLTDSVFIVNRELLPFLEEHEGKADITVQLSRDWESVKLPVTEPTGEDALLKYYAEGDVRFCITKGGPKGPVACTCYTSDFRKVRCTLNDEPFLMPPKTLGSVLRMLPMREIFLHFHILFLHGSQIAVRQKGIVFSAPSGGGKSTQAMLWKTYRDAKIICNDRTLLQKDKGQWYTHGYPLDGSAPVCSGQVFGLGSVVLLEQGVTNEVQRLKARSAVARLMHQVVMDAWSSESRNRTLELLLELMNDIPVYLLTCTADERAVEILEAKLMEVGVL